jgi:hypothetical protein
MIAIYSSMFFKKKIHQQLCCPACIDREDKRVKSLQIYREKNKKKKGRVHKNYSAGTISLSFFGRPCVKIVYTIYFLSRPCVTAS